MQKGYKARFFDDLLKNLTALQNQITVNEKGHVTNSLKNTCLFARALHNTFNDAGDVAGMMLMLTACDYTPLIEAEAVAQEKHDAELKTAVETIAHRLNEG